MPEGVSNRVKTGRIPYKRFPVLYFFSPVLMRELEGLTPYLRAYSGVQRTTLPMGRFSFRGMAASFKLSLPAPFVLPTAANWRAGREGEHPGRFELKGSYEFFSQLYELLVRFPDGRSQVGEPAGQDTAPGIGRRIRALADSNEWSALFDLMFEDKSQDHTRYQSCRDLKNTMATLSAGVTLMLTQRVPGAQGSGFAGEILNLPRTAVDEVREKQAYHHLELFAERVGISFGWALALYCLLYERPGGEGVRLAASKSPDHFISALDEVVWGGFDRQYKVSENYTLYRRFLKGEKISPPRPGRKKKVVASDASHDEQEGRGNELAAVVEDPQEAPPAPAAPMPAAPAPTAPPAVSSPTMPDAKMATEAKTEAVPAKPRQVAKRFADFFEEGTP